MAEAVPPVWLSVRGRGLAADFSLVAKALGAVLGATGEQLRHGRAVPREAFSSADDKNKTRPQQRQGAAISGQCGSCHHWQRLVVLWGLLRWVAVLGLTAARRVVRTQAPALVAFHRVLAIRSVALARMGQLACGVVSMQAAAQRSALASVATWSALAMGQG